MNIYLLWTLVAVAGVAVGVGAAFLWFAWQADRTTEYDIDVFLTALAADPKTRNLTVVALLTSRGGTAP